MMMILILLITVGAVFIEGSDLINTNLNEDWNLFKTIFNKTYKDGDEELIRRSIWEDNLGYIQKHNLEYDLGKHTFTTGVNQFADLTLKEFNTIYLPRTFSNETGDGENYQPPLNVNIEGITIDWRNKGFVTGVKNQGACGSCWAFSTTGSLEGQYFRKYGKLISLSEQQLVDCSKAFGNNGCYGGLMSNAFKYIHAVGGIEREMTYPYIGQQMMCKFNKAFAVTSVHGYISIAKSEAILAMAVLHNGPISIAIDASKNSFRFYRSGIYFEPTCSNIRLNHAVLIVGYGKDILNRPYWIVKNSWGTIWGNNGYILMTKDRNNQCGVASLAGFPSV